MGSEAVVVIPESAGELPGEVVPGVVSAPPSGVRWESLGGFDRWVRCASHRLIACDPSGILRERAEAWWRRSPAKRSSRASCRSRTDLRSAVLERTG